MIVSLAEAVQAREQARARGRAVAVANGAFDLLHVGHLRYLEDAKRLALASGVGGEGGLLIVGVNTDASVRAGKGPSRPLVPQDERAELVAALRCVDLVVLFDEPTAEALLAALRPDLHVKGTDYTVEGVPERALVERLGGRTVIAGDPKDHSTTDLLARLRDRLK
jgi:rfaE bifunctional protein nucleotidyltransferase chain/domain